MEILPVFENLGFPIAVCVVLFSILSYFIKKSLELIKSYLERVQEKEAKHQEFMCSLLKEQSSIIAANTSALNNFSLTLGDLCSVLEKHKKENN